MLCLVIVTNLFNPSLSVSMLLPDNNTSESYQYIYNIEFANVFTHDDPTFGIFLDYFLKNEYMHYPSYFLNSGYPLTLRAAGGGVQLKLNTGSIVEWDFKIGYFTGGLSYPVVLDSGIVTRETISRASLGAGAAMNILKDVGRLRIGIKISGNLIPFGQRPAIIVHEPPYLAETSLNTFGVGIVIGFDPQEAP
jgi:hypothetical protein